MTGHTEPGPGIARRIGDALALAVIHLPEAQVIAALAIAWAAIR